MARQSAEGGPKAGRRPVECAITQPARPDGGAQQAQNRWIKAESPPASPGVPHTWPVEQPGRVKRGVGPALIALAGVLVVAAIGFGLLRQQGVIGSNDCEVTVNDHRVRMSQEQAENASLIAAIAVQRGLPARAVSIALATAYQESGLRNLKDGDRDSVGLFQQRPSQGWGSNAELRDPAYASNAFYDALVKIEDYRELEITEAAQEVQRSAFPTAYADHEDDARALASALTGNSPEALVCSVDDDANEASAALTASGLTKRADVVRRDVEARFAPLPLGGFAPGGVDSGHMEGSAHYDGRAVDIFVRPINAANKQRGWAIAQYLVANADRLTVQTVIFDDRIWRAGRDEWRNYDPPSNAGDRAILEHRDHVHVDVFR